MNRLSLLRWSIAIVLIVTAATALFAKTKNYGFMGWDTYPIIASSRIQSLDDVTANFTEQLMAGRHPEGFYRPVLNLTIAFDYALWGLKPTGYQLTNIMIFACCAAALYLLMSRMVGGNSLAAPLVALGFFMMHSTHFEVLPVAARRPELLCCLFMVMALGSQLSERALVAARPPIMPAIFALLAFASKETAFVLPVIVLAAVWLYSPRSTPWSRFHHGLKAVVPHLVAFGAVLLSRLAILGGLGGARSAGIAQTLTTLPRAFGRMFEYLLFSQPAMRTSPLGRWLPAILIICVALTGFLVRRTQHKSDCRSTGTSRELRLALVALVWLLTVTLAYAATGRLRPWYMPVPVAGMAMLIGALAGWLTTVWHRGKGLIRAAVGPAFVASIAFVLWQGSYAPIVRTYGEWQRATAVSHTFLEDLKTKIEHTPDGSVVEAAPIPIWAEPTRGGLQIRGAAILADYTIEAWAELTFPNRQVRVCQVGDKDCGRVRSDELHVMLTERLPGY